jgi:glycosyltransferase involved in cell wall biosynthesis
MKVTLVSTVKNSADHVGEFLESLRAQTRAPDEIVVVDGGSTDGTLEVLRGAEDVTLIEEPGANIARGRNVAIAAATHDVIAVSDADCVLAPDWLERLLEPIERGADVSMGAYRPLALSFFQVCAAAISVPDPSELRAETFMPSSRSVAFRRAAYLEAGGYPEELDKGEDMWLDLRWREQDARMDLAPEAVAYWRVRPSLAEHWRQYADYARFDAIGGMWPGRHAIRFATCAAAAVALRRRGTLLGLAALAGAAYASKPIRRATRLLPPGPERVAAGAAVPVMMAFTDLAKMTGYVRGLFERRRRGG